jgi:hypothetical protein
MCSPRVFPIAPCFNPICFAQSPPLLTYIAGPKEKTLDLSIESFIFGEALWFQFHYATDQSNWFIVKKKYKVELVRHPQTNKYETK